MVENSFSNNLSRSTVAGYLNYWLKVYCEPKLAPNTINGNRQILKSMLQNAVPAKIVSAMLGHSSIGITMDTYSHVLTDMQEGATSKMNTLLKKLY